MTLRPDDFRAALFQELAKRGVTDPKSEELDFLEEAMTSPRRAVAKQMVQQVRLLGSVVRLFRDEMTYAQPRWALIPDNVPSAPSDEAINGEVVSVDLTPERLISGRSTIGRVIAEIRDQNQESDEEEIRPVGAWVSLASESSIGVHLGKYQVAELHGAEAAPIRAAIERWGAGTKTLRADADLLGATAETTHIDLFMPTPTHK
jgi:hypothetical protein